MRCNILIVGAGIAGSCLAYQLFKKNVSYLQITDMDNPLNNTSAKSYGHSRIVDNPEELFEKSRKYLKCQVYEFFYYENSHLVKDFFKELKVPYEKKAFGIIPKGVARGGATILKKIHSIIPPITHDIFVKRVNRIKRGKGVKTKEKDNHDFFVITNKGRIYCKYVVFAIGGFGQFYYNSDAVTYKSPSIYNQFERRIINKKSFFVHPFGINKGKDVLIGTQTMNGKFVDEENNHFFPEDITIKLKNNDYHEIFPRIVSEMKNRRCYFVRKGSCKKIKVEPVVHYTSGGFKTNRYNRIIGEKNIFSIGECQADGSKNGGRLPGMPFTKSIVSAYILANYLYSIQ